MTHVKQVFTLIFVGLFTITLAACSDDNAEQAEDKLDSLKESTSKVFKDAKEAAADATDKAKEMAEDAADKAEELAEDTADAIEDTCEKAKDKLDMEDKDC